MDGVVSVKKIENPADGKTFFNSVYEIIFNQPLNWNNFSDGYFEQRVIFGFNDKNKKTAVSIEGYSFSEDNYCFTEDDIDEIPKMFDCNYINVEHRFYGKSVPSSLSTDSKDLWEYLTVYNAACDVHKIIGEFKNILKNKYIIYGVSKGGYMTNVQSLFFPEDAEVFVSYVANCCNSIEDERLYNFTYNEIGNDYYGKEKAGNYRNLIKQFQNWCLNNKDLLVPDIFNNDTENAKYRDYISDENILYFILSEFAVNFWQYNTDFSLLNYFISMPEDDEFQIINKKNKALSILSLCTSEELFSYTSDMLPYYFQAYTELGNYKLDLSYLNNDIFDDDKLYFKLLLSQEQIENFKYDDEIYCKLLEWTQTTKSNVLMIYGKLDPWYSVRFPESENSHIHFYVDEKENHNACISSFDNDTKNRIISDIESCL